MRSTSTRTPASSTAEVGSARILILSAGGPMCRPAEAVSTRKQVTPPSPPPAVRAQMFRTWATSACPTQALTPVSR